MNINVTKIDGTELTVGIKKIGINSLPKLLDDKLSMEAKADLFLGGDVKTSELDPDSQMDVYEAGMELNEPNMLRFMDRQKKQVKLMTGMDMGDLLRGKVGELTSYSGGTD